MSVGRTPILLRTQEDVTAAVGTVSIALVLVYAMFRRLRICAVRGGFMRVALAIAVGSCLLATASEAVAQMPPNDTDLKAAFCAGVLKSFVEGSEKSQLSTDPAIASLARKSKEQLFAAQQRVLAYLMPRMQFVDQSSLIFALTEGKRASEQNVARWIECQSDSGSLTAFSAREWKAWDKALNKCLGPTQVRIQECMAPSFLPF